MTGSGTSASQLLATSLTHGGVLLPGFAAQATFRVFSTCAIIALPAFRLTASGIDEAPTNAQDSELIDNRNQSTFSATLPRRQFLKLMTATSAAIFLPGHLVATDLSYPHRPQKSQIRSKNLGSTSRQGDALRVMTYNVWGIPTSKDRAARMVAIGRKLATMNLDIVGLPPALAGGSWLNVVKLKVQNPDRSGQVLRLRIQLYL
jgi:hypothetical protein